MEVGSREHAGQPGTAQSPAGALLDKTLTRKDSAGTSGGIAPCPGDMSKLIEENSDLSCRLPEPCVNLPTSSDKEVQEHIALLNSTCWSFEIDCMAAAYANEVISAQQETAKEHILQMQREVKQLDEEWARTMLKLQEINESMAVFYSDVEKMQAASQSVRARAAAVPSNERLGAALASTPEPTSKPPEQTVDVPKDGRPSADLGTTTAPVDGGHTNLSSAPSATVAPVAPTKWEDSAARANASNGTSTRGAASSGNATSNGTAVGDRVAKDGNTSSNRTAVGDTVAKGGNATSHGTAVVDTLTQVGNATSNGRAVGGTVAKSRAAVPETRAAKETSASNASDTSAAKAALNNPQSSIQAAAAAATTVPATNVRVPAYSAVPGNHRLSNSHSSAQAAAIHIGRPLNGDSSDFASKSSFKLLQSDAYLAAPSETQSSAQAVTTLAIEASPSDSLSSAQAAGTITGNTLGDTPIVNALKATVKSLQSADQLSAIARSDAQSSAQEDVMADAVALGLDLSALDT